MSLRAGVTFRYTADGPEGLLKGKKAVVIESRAGLYSEGPAAAMDGQEPHLRTLLGFIGLDDVDLRPRREARLRPGRRRPRSPRRSTSCAASPPKSAAGGLNSAHRGRPPLRLLAASGRVSYAHPEEKRDEALLRPGRLLAGPAHRRPRSRPSDRPRQGETFPTRRPTTATTLTASTPRARCRRSASTTARC